MSFLASEPAAIRAELARILASPGFARSPRMRRFLTFVVEETLAGNAEAIKEYVIGVRVFDKPETYDPQGDSTVRSEAVKLRAKLDRYYESTAERESLVISIPKGSYVPVFAVRKDGPHHPSAELSEAPAVEGQGTAGPPTGVSNIHRLWLGRWIVALAAVLVLSASAVWYRSAAGDDRRLPTLPVPLTTYPGQELQPSFSPDGNKVAFVWDGERQDNFDIYVKQIESDQPLRITSDAQADSDPAWSPDGRFLAFCRVTGPAARAVYIIPAVGGTERKLAETRQPGVFWPQPLLAWSPDSKWLVISDVDDPEKVSAPSGFTPGSLFLLSIDTGQKRRLTFHSERPFVDAGPAFSPDGRSLAFVRTSAPPLSDLYVVPMSADFVPVADPRPLTSWNRFTTSPAWLRNGKELIVAAGIWENVGLWRVDASGKGSARRLEFTGDHATDPALSQQGHLAYSQTTSDANIWRADLFHGAAEIASESPVIASTRTDINPQFSPDGKRIAYCSDRSGNIEVWTSHENGSNAIQVTSMGAAVTGSPRWSPDGTRIVYDSNKEGQFEVYVINATGGPPKRLTYNPSADGAASWSRDGQSVYFMSNRGGARHIWKVPSGGGEAVQVTKQGGHVSFESPDGRYLYFSAPATIDGHIAMSGLWQVPVKGGEEELVLPSVTFLNFAIARDGIYFIPAADADRGYSVQFFSFATRKTRPVLRLGARQSIGLSLSPDGHSLLYTRTDEKKSDLMLVERVE